MVLQFDIGKMNLKLPIFSNFYPTFKLPTITHDVNNFQLLGTHLSGLTASTAIMVPIPENKYGQLVRMQFHLWNR
mgnify:CR=1 FL=1